MPGAAAQRCKRHSGRVPVRKTESSQRERVWRGGRVCIVYTTQRGHPKYQQAPRPCPVDGTSLVLDKITVRPRTTNGTDRVPESRGPRPAGQRSSWLSFRKRE